MNMKRTFSKEIILFIFGILLSLAIRLFFTLKGAALADVLRMYEVAQKVLSGGNPYQTYGFYIYPPLWMQVEYFSLLVSRVFLIPFQTVIKIWPNVADLLIGIVIYVFLTNNKVKPAISVPWSLFYILNPVSILISSVHGQFDSIVSLFTLLSIFFITFFKTPKFFYLSALMFGIAIAFKPNPVMLLPFFLLYKNVNFIKRIKYLLVTAVPITLTLLPYVFISPREVLTSILGYSGAYDFGYAAIFRGLWYQNNANYWFPYSDQFLSISKVLFLFLSIFIYFFFANPPAGRAGKKVYVSSLALYLLFLIVYFGISGQYYLWIIPLAIIAREKLVILFSILVTFALLAFYLFFNPSLIISSIVTKPFQSIFMSVYFFANVFPWIFCLFWLVKLIRNYVPVRKVR